MPPFGWTQTWLYPVGAWAFDESPEGARDLLTGPSQLLRDHYSPYFYLSSPELNPLSQTGVFFAVRGAVTPHGDLAALGYARPYPAWVREGNLGGGIRCAREDVDQGVGEEYFTRRQRLLAGESNAGRGP